MNYDLRTPPYFRRRVKRFLRQHPDLEAPLESVFSLLRQDPNDPSLRLHPLLGKLKGHHAVSVTYEYRIVLVLKKVDEAIILIDIGDHDDVYR